MTNLQDIREKKVPITIGDKTYNLHYNMNAYAEIENIYGSVDKAMKILEDTENRQINALRTLFWAGLIHENENLTEKDVGNLFDLSEMDTLAELLKKAIEQSAPKTQAKNVKSQAQKK